MTSKKKVIILTGAGISAESGIPTFRASDGLWENHRVEDVASPEGWRRNPAMVLEFYNQRRAQVQTVQPNQGHFDLVEMEKHFDVMVITQNIDNLHERAGSIGILHLHGEILKACSNTEPRKIIDCKGDIKMGDLCPKGTQLRPYIVWFGEAVPMLEIAADLVAEADYFVIVGTSLQVYPAAGLMMYAPSGTPFFYVDPNPNVDGNTKQMMKNLTIVAEPASTGVRKVLDLLLALK
jgi:NAD-dependent deacetylase